MGVLWKTLEIMQRDLDIVFYEREQDNKTIYDISCRLGQISTAQGDRLGRIEQDLQAMFNRFWGVIVSALGAIVAAIALASIFRK